MPVEDLESGLLRGAIGGDRAALSQLFLLHYDGLRQYIARRLPGGLEPLVSDADILHQTMVRAARGIGRFQPVHDGAFRAWLTTIADNLIKDAQKKKRRQRRAGDGALAGQGSSVEALVEKIAGDATSPSVRTERRDNARRLHAALAALPEEHRHVIERYYLRGQSLDQIAEAMGSTKGAVRALAYRARKRLRELMGRSSQYFSG